MTQVLRGGRLSVKAEIITTVDATLKWVNRARRTEGHEVCELKLEPFDGSVADDWIDVPGIPKERLIYEKTGGSWSLLDELRVMNSVDRARGEHRHDLVEKDHANLIIG